MPILLFSNLSLRSASWTRFLVLMIALLALVAPVRAAEPVTGRAVPQFDTVAPGGRLVVAVELTFAEGYHAWPNEEVKLAPALADFAIRAEIGGKDLPAWAQAAGTQYPVAHATKVPDPSGAGPTMDAEVFSGKIVAFVRINIGKDAPVGDQTLTVVASYQACNAEACLPPADLTFKVRVKIAADGKPGKANEPALFATYDATKWPGASPPTPKPAPAPAPQAATAPPKPVSQAHDAAMPQANGPSIFGIPLAGGIVILFLVSCLGGFILNLTPCVLPVIPIKVLTLTSHAGEDHRRALVLGVVMALGVVCFWAAVGVPVALWGAAADPSRLIFGRWWITLGLGMVIGLMGLGIMGLFAINLPQSVYAINPKVDSLHGSFLFGVMTGVLGLPCFGFVAGGLIPVTAALSAPKVMTIFLGLGVGMAAPYLVLSARPQLLKFLPRTGPASDLVKQFMGLLLLAAAAFFAAAGIKALLNEKPYFSATIVWWAVAFFVALAHLWLVMRTFAITRKSLPRGLILVGSAAVLGVMFFMVVGAGRVAREDYEHILAEKDKPVITGAWVEYTQERFDKARAAGKVVVLDFTANWCINCKFLKSSVLDREPIRHLLVSDDVVLLEVDLSDESAPGWKVLRGLGRTAVPTLAVFGPGTKEPVILNAYTSDMVLTALKTVGLPAIVGEARALPASGGV